MKLFTFSKLSLGIALLGTALTSAIQPAQARPQRDRDDTRNDTNRRGDWRNDRDKDRDNDRHTGRYDHRDQRRNRRGSRRGGNYGYGNNGTYGNGGYDNGYGYGGNYGYEGNYDYGNSGSGYGNQSFTGRVTKVKSADEFDLRIGNTIYNVYTDGRAPRRLSVGDTVRVYGQRVGKNDIRNASTSLLNNRR